jgi:hypothetical protein
LEVNKFGGTSKLHGHRRDVGTGSTERGYRYE